MELFRSPTFKKEYRQLPDDVRERAKRAIRLLMENPRHPSLVVKKMRGVEGIWEARVSLSYRITYEVAGETLILRRIGTHDVLRREHRS